MESLESGKIFEELPVPRRLAAAKEKERRNQELKDALEESERKMQEVMIQLSPYSFNSVFSR